MPAGSPYDLERARWRSLLMRAAVFRATRAKLEEFCDHIDRGGAALMVLTELEMQVNELAFGKADELNDDALIGRIVDVWDKRLAATLELSQLDTELRQLLEEIRELLATACATDPFQEIFAGVAAKASEIYRDSWRPVSLEMAHLGGPPRDGSDPYAVTAATEWLDEATAKVELAIHDAGFRPNSFAAIPMLFAHECICHVPARQKETVDNESTFAEGLLDWVAYDLHENWAGKLDSVLAPAARQHAKHLRYFLTRHNSARKRGHNAAENLRTWFENHDMDQQQFEGQAASPALAVMQVVKLAIELNVVDRELADKDHFVALLGWPFPPHVEAALRAWLAQEITADALLDVGPRL